MRILIFIVLTFSLQSFAFAFSTPPVSFFAPQNVRVRTFKNLSEWPQVRGAKVGSLNPHAWSLMGKNLIYSGKRLSTHNVILKKGNGFEIVSVFNFNNYLAGVVASEMPVNWPMEALKAQAVVARSFTLAKLREKGFAGQNERSSYYDMESDENDQMFSVTTSSKAYMAVVETDEVILSDRRGNPLKAYYHSDCGGETVKASDVWGGAGFNAGTARDPWCAARTSSNWKYEVEKSEFFRKLGLHQNRSIVSKINWAGRSQTLALFGETFSVQKLRQIFGFAKIRSTPSAIEIGANIVRISGQGFGHGSGLCQWGSRAQALQGIGFSEMLLHYYPNANLSNSKPKIAVVLQQNRPLFAASPVVSD